ncbi:MAG: hypothetical protein NT005_12915 [Spirochaetes bacterium]|nr:hypothetical protein [Spirochaetota bacterium]
MLGIDQKSLGMNAPGTGAGMKRLAVFAAAALLLASCATAPVRSPAGWMGVLPGDDTMYVSVSVPPSAALIKKMLKNAGPGTADIVRLVDVTERVVLGVRLVPHQQPRFTAVAIGSYPASIIRCRLTGNREWKRITTPAGRYWQWSKTGIQIAITGRTILLAANGEVETLLPRYESPVALRIPPEVSLDMENADLVLYLPELPGGITQGSSARVPIQEVWLDAAKSEGGYGVMGTANTGSERDAKLVALVLRLALVAWLRSENLPNTAERLKTVTISADGTQVKMSGLAFTEEEIVTLFLSLLKGPAQPADGSGT